MLSYRKELDGLRALAVVAVIIYHANLEIFGFHIFQGGFFGVDVFFVLSGYLITAIIRNDLEKGRFSFANFYWRRAKRIVPALITMLAVTSVVAYFVLLPSDLDTYADSLKSTLYFGSNYYFYSEDSYTADASILKPLLHTWSLAVEWQFYIIYPVIVWFINRFFKQYMFEAILGLALLSLQFSSFIVGNNPDMAFYLLPSRAWELLLGGLATFYNRDRIFVSVEDGVGSFFYKALPLLGLFLISHSMIFFGHEINHPSFITLIPVLGTLLFLMFSHEGEASSDILSLKPFVFIGLVSYSLYLWHQPVFVFFRVLKYENIRPEQLLLLIAISFLISYLTYKYVEAKFRRNVINKFSLGIVFTLFLLLVSNYYGVKYFIDEFHDKPLTIVSMEAKNRNPYKCMVGGKTELDSLSYCYLGNESNVKAIVVGDSHADALTTSIASIFNLDNEGVVAITRAGCPFILNAKNNKNGDVCYEENFLRMKEIKSKYSGVPIFFIGRWSAYIYGQSNPSRVKGDNRASMYFGENKHMKEESLINSFYDNLKLTLCEISSKSPVYITQPIPEMRRNIPSTMAKDISQGIRGRDYSIDVKLYHQRNDRVRSVISSASNLCGVSVIDPINILCRSGRCLAEVDGRPIYYDGDHMSEFGNKLLTPLFKQALNDLP